MMADTASICKRYALFNDIERGDFAYGAYAILSWLFYHKSYICHDGKLSIKRSYTKNELCAIIPKGWIVKRLLPYRLLVIHEPREDILNRGSFFTYIPYLLIFIMKIKMVPL